MYNIHQNAYFQSMQDQQEAFAEWQESMREMFSQQDKFMREQNEILRRQFDEYRARISANPPHMGVNQFMQPPACRPYYTPYGIDDEKIIKIFEMISIRVPNKVDLDILASNIIELIDPTVRIEYIPDDDDDDKHMSIVINHDGSYSKQYSVELKGKV